MIKKIEKVTRKEQRFIRIYFSYKSTLFSYKSKFFNLKSRKAKKDEQIKEEVKNKQRGEKLKTKYEKEAEKERQQECERSFQEFLKNKGTWKRPPPSPTLKQRFEQF